MIGKSKIKLLKLFSKRCGQSILEYTVLITVVSLAFAAMRPYVQRAVQANLKLLQDQVNDEPQ